MIAITKKLINLLLFEVQKREEGKSLRSVKSHSDKEKEERGKKCPEKFTGKALTKSGSMQDLGVGRD